MQILNLKTLCTFYVCEKYFWKWNIFSGALYFTGFNNQLQAQFFLKHAVFIFTISLYTRHNILKELGICINSVGIYGHLKMRKCLILIFACEKNPTPHL